jgi:integrase
MRGVVRPVQQGSGEPLTSETSPHAAAHPAGTRARAFGSRGRVGWRVRRDHGTGRQASTWAIERAIRSARPKVPGLPEAFRFFDLRHYLASLLTGSGLDVKVVQHRPRHGSAKTTLDTYGHMWPDSDESPRAAIGAVLAARGDSSGTVTASQAQEPWSAACTTQMS